MILNKKNYFLAGGQVHAQHTQMLLQQDSLMQTHPQMQMQSQMDHQTGMMDPNQQRMGVGMQGMSPRYQNTQQQQYMQQQHMQQQQQMQQHQMQQQQLPPHMRRQGPMKLDAHGQVILETDENLSDKEIYPNQMGKPPCSMYSHIEVH